jgi:agmatine deiminase
MKMPAEWAAHRATWIAWPHNRTDWPGKFAAIPWVYGEIIRHLTQHERVGLLVADTTEEKAARRILTRVGADLGEVDFVRCATDRVWTRDSGPTFVHAKSGLCAVHWCFNAWAKYPDWKKDRKVAAAIARARGIDLVQARSGDHWVVLEGGAIDVDGEGTLLATEECLLDSVQARNPELSKTQLEGALAEYLGVRRVVWLGRGIVGDDTHGHIDDLARFVAPGRVVLVQESNPHDENYALLAENRERLQGARLEVIALPMPRPLVFEGRRLPASYANFYIANGLVLVPTFNDPADRTALGILAELFPDREIVGIHAVDLVWGLGTLHCMTQQEPAG